MSNSNTPGGSSSAAVDHDMDMFDLPEPPTSTHATREEPSQPLRIPRVFNVTINIVGSSAQDATAIAANVVNSIPGTVTVNHSNNTGLLASASRIYPGASGSSSYTQGFPSSPLAGPSYAQGGSSFLGWRPSAAMGSPSTSTAVPEGPPTCKICYKNNVDRVIQPCGHFVHITCVTEWFSIQRRCPDPLCKKPCHLSDLIKLGD